LECFRKDALDDRILAYYQKNAIGDLRRLPPFGETGLA
jgi:hypothetical protein